MPARLLRLLVAAALALPLAGLVPAARADGDPASDVLYVKDVFVPFGAGNSTQLERLLATQAAAKKAGYRIKVALIGGPSDLGSVPELFGQPERYARFLGLELTFLYKGRLLIVMPSGFGVYHPHQPAARERALLRRVRIGQGIDGLAASATEAIRRLAAAHGVRVPAVRVSAVPRSATGEAGSVSHGGSSTTRDRLAIAAAAVAAAALAGALMVWRRRRVRRTSQAT